MAKKLIGTREAAEILGMQPRTVTGYCQQGTLIAHRTPSGWRIEKASVTALCKELARKKREAEKQAAKAAKEAQKKAEPKKNTSKTKKPQKAVKKATKKGRK